MGFPGGSDDKESACSAGDPCSIPGSERFPWRRRWLLTPVFMPGEFHGQKNLVGYRPWGLISILQSILAFYNEQNQ